jgi:hypothetical protein
MPRNLSRQVAFDAEPMLAEIKTTSVRSTWLPAFAATSAMLDTSRWQTRAARGLSWNRSGKPIKSRGAH